MSATLEDLASRLRQLERELQELTVTVSHRPPSPEAGDLADRISFRAWMRISAPTFGVMVMGFTLLWNAQQATSAQMFEMTRTLGRLDGTIARLEATTARSEERLEARLAGIDERLAGIDETLAGIDETLAGMDATLGRLSGAVEKLEARLQL